MNRPTEGFPGAVRRGFTLVELLVVIVIIGILAGLALMVGGKVTTGGKRSQTEYTIRTLDAMLGAYLNERGKFPSYYIDYHQPGKYFPIIDGRADTAGIADPAEPTIAYFFLIASDVPSVQQSVQSLDPKLVTHADIKRADGEYVLDHTGAHAMGTFVNDAWGNPIRFVIPANHGGHGHFADSSGNLVSGRQNKTISYAAENFSQAYRRSWRPFDSTQVGKGVGDADEGMCTGGRPYFYSAGEDGDPGTRDDNVYSIVPQFPLETRDIKP